MSRPALALAWLGGGLATLLATIAAAAPAFAQPAPPGAKAEDGWSAALFRPINVPAMLQAIARAYPEAIAQIGPDKVIFNDGATLPIAAQPIRSSFEQWLAGAGILDQFAMPYPLGGPLRAPAVNEDPGRARNEGFFLKLYGDCRKGEVERQLVSVEWLPGSLGARVMFTRAQGAAAALQRVSADLDKLPARFLPFLRPTGGTYNCRAIAGVNRLSMHAYGASIDLAVEKSHYWRWEKPDAAGRRIWRNQFPREIVEIFERHGFVWGGRWYHYDSMHFEYRPELIAYARTTAVQPAMPGETILPPGANTLPSPPPETDAREAPQQGEPRE